MTDDRKGWDGGGPQFFVGRMLWVSAPSDSGMLNLVEILVPSIVVMSEKEPHP